MLEALEKILEPVVDRYTTEEIFFIKNKFSHYISRALQKNMVVKRNCSSN